MKIKNGGEIKKAFRKNFSGIAEWSDGVYSRSFLQIKYYKNGDIHNENGYAIINLFETGNDLWGCNGSLYFEESVWKYEIDKLKKK
jgi:hypothetical protein